MSWNSASDFFAMGGYGLYVWGSFGACALALVLEPLLVARRHGNVLRGLRLTDRAMREGGYKAPRIAVAGLNPHAGENGLLGKEEGDIVAPVIQQFAQDGKLVFGPFPADGYFGTQQFRQFDATLALYHDQGLIPFKLMAFERGVNFTAGLNVVRTSPDHGTAYGLAGQYRADESSFRAAVYLACDIWKQRQANAEPRSAR